MAIITRRAALAAGLVGSGLLAPGLARADAAWPVRPVRVVIAWPPGGGADIPVRLAAPAMSLFLGQTLVLENRAGASGSVGAGAVVQAAPDGYTVLADTAAISVNHMLVPGLPYDAATALIPVSQLVISPLLLVVRADHPSRTLEALVARLKARPGAIPYGHSGTGTATHLAPVSLLRQAGATANHVAYRGGAASIAGLLAGDCEFVFSTLPQSAPLVQEGRLRGLAVSSATRVGSLPEVPTVAEQGYPGFDLTDWLGLYLPAGTPAPIVARLAEAAAVGMRDPAALAGLARLGMVPVGSGPAAFAAYWRDQREKLGALIREEGIRAE